MDTAFGIQMTSFRARSEAFKNATFFTASSVLLSIDANKKILSALQQHRLCTYCTTGLKRTNSTHACTLHSLPTAYMSQCFRNCVKCVAAMRFAAKLTCAPIYKLLAWSLKTSLHSANTSRPSTTITTCVACVLVAHCLRLLPLLSAYMCISMSTVL